MICFISVTLVLSINCIGKNKIRSVIRFIPKELSLDFVEGPTPGIDSKFLSSNFKLLIIFHLLATKIASISTSTSFGSLLTSTAALAG